jgi:hypothetical protein
VNWDLKNFSVIQTCDITMPPLFSVFFISGQYISAQDISAQPYWILRGEECVELNLHSTRLLVHIHGVVLKLRINLEFLNFNMSQERLLQKGKKKTSSRKFAKLWKATISFVMSVRPSLRMQQLGCHWTDVHEIWYLSIFRKICRENSIVINIQQE